MPTYLMLSTLTPEGSKTLHQRPDRLDEVNREIEQFGCKIVSQYALLGQYDFATIVEAADNETIGHLAVDLASRGTVTTQTLPASPMSDFIAKLKSKAQIGKS